MKKGIDLSVYNEIKDYNQIKKNVDFVILRTGYGKHVTQKDKKFEEYYEHFKDIPLGVYHYSYASSKAGAILEAENCIEFLKNKKLTLPVFYDLEDKTINVSKNILTDMIKTVDINVDYYIYEWYDKNKSRKYYKIITFINYLQMI